MPFCCTGQKAIVFFAVATFAGHLQPALAVCTGSTIGTVTPSGCAQAYSGESTTIVATPSKTPNTKPAQIDNHVLPVSLIF
jgi:hypothetical protein